MNDSAQQQVDDAFASADEFRRDHESRFGRAIERERNRRGWTADEAAQHADMASKTWQRLEDGKAVRNATYRKLDILFGLDLGTTLRCWQGEKDLQEILDNKRPTAVTLFPGDDAPTGESLAARISDLDVDDLKRLRDIIDGAIFMRLPTPTREEREETRERINSLKIGLYELRVMKEQAHQDGDYSALDDVRRRENQLLHDLGEVESRYMQMMRKSARSVYSVGQDEEARKESDDGER